MASEPLSDFQLVLRPITLRVARRFVADHHRHSEPPPGWLWGVGVECDGELVGVAMASPPKARQLQAENPFMLEICRTCTTGVPNANSMLYGAMARAAKALGYQRLITYTLPHEPGSSLKAAGWREDAVTDGLPGWHRHGAVRETLFGPARFPSGPKVRWTKDLQ